MTLAARPAALAGLACHLINSLVYDQDESTSIGRGLLGILPIENAASLVSCGVAFTTPSEGRLKIGAEAQNFYNKVTFSVTDESDSRRRRSGSAWACSHSSCAERKRWSASARHCSRPA